MWDGLRVNCVYMCVRVECVLGVNRNTSKQHTTWLKVYEKMLCKHNPVLIFPSRTQNDVWKDMEMCINMCVDECVCQRACVRACESEEENGGKKWEEKTCAENKSKTIRLNKNNLKLIVSILYILGIPTVHIDGLSWLAYKRINTSSHHHHHLRLSPSSTPSISEKEISQCCDEDVSWQHTLTHTPPIQPTNEKKIEFERKPIHFVSIILLSSLLVRFTMLFGAVKVSKTKSEKRKIECVWVRMRMREVGKDEWKRLKANERTNNEKYYQHTWLWNIS